MNEATGGSPHRAGDDIESLIHACLDGRACGEELARLEERLLGDPAARDLYLEVADLHACLAVDEQLWVGPMAEAAVRGGTGEMVADRRLPWLLHGSLPAAVAGLIVGVLGAGLAFGYVTLSAGNGMAVTRPVRVILREGYESGPTPRDQGLGADAGVWSGDSATVVAAEQGVAPHGGSRMLRLLRADYPGKSRPAAEQVSYAADQYRLVDLRPYAAYVATGGAVARLSAAVNAAEFPADEEYRCTLSLYALDVETAALLGPAVASGLADASLAMAHNRNALLDRDSRTWQLADCGLPLPADATHLLVRVGVVHGTPAQRREDFAGHYVDDVKLVLETAGQTMP